MYGHTYTGEDLREKADNASLALEEQTHIGVLAAASLVDRVGELTLEVARVADMLEKIVELVFDEGRAIRVDDGRG